MPPVLPMLLAFCIITGPLSFEGRASYYGNEFEGRRTASGERYHGALLTAAHRSLPFGTWIRVTRPDTGDSVVVRVNDRGPFVAGRVVDLSRSAAEAIGMIPRGVVPVLVELIPAPSERVLVELAQVRELRGSLPLYVDTVSILHVSLPLGYEGLLEIAPSLDYAETRVAWFRVSGRIRRPISEVTTQSPGNARYRVRLMSPPAADGAGDQAVGAIGEPIYPVETSPLPVDAPISIPVDPLPPTEPLFPLPALDRPPAP